VQPKAAKTVSAVRKEEKMKKVLVKIEINNWDDKKNRKKILNWLLRCHRELSKEKFQHLYGKEIEAILYK